MAFFDGASDAARDAISAGRAALGLTPWREWTMCVQAYVAWGQGDHSTAWQQVRAMLPEGPATEPGGQMFGPALELQCLAINLSMGFILRRRRRLEAARHRRCRLRRGRSGA